MPMTHEYSRHALSSGAGKYFVAMEMQAGSRTTATIRTAWHFLIIRTEHSVSLVQITRLDIWCSSNLITVHSVRVCILYNSTYENPTRNRHDKTFQNPRFFQPP